MDNRLTAASPRAEQPPWIKTPLRPHQLSLLAAAHTLETRASINKLPGRDPYLLTQYGVIADKVGTGKSLVALSLVRGPLVNRTEMEICSSGGVQLISTCQMPSIKEILPGWMDLTGKDLTEKLFPQSHSLWHTRTALAIVPHNVTTQWEQYVTEQTSLNCVFIKRIADCDSDKNGFMQKVLTADLVVCSNTMISRFMGAMVMSSQRYIDFAEFSRFVWSRLFIDEADTIHCAIKPEHISARFIWLITGSWKNMLVPSGVSAGFISHFDAGARTALGEGGIPGITYTQHIVGALLPRNYNTAYVDTILRNSEEWINTSLREPVIVHSNIVCSSPASLPLLSGYVSPAVMTALHAGDTRGALAALNLVSEDKTSIVDKVTASLRLKLDEAERTYAFKETKTYSSAAAKEEALTKARDKIARFREQLEALNARIAAIDTIECPICYDPPRSTVLTPCCRNAFCLSCLCECIVAKPACPMCRAEITSMKNVIVLGEGSESESAMGGGGDEPLPTKAAALLKILTEASEEQRFLIFSEHEGSFRGLQELLRDRDIQCRLLQGSSTQVNALRKQFQKGTVRVLCMNAKHVGSGLNLDCTTDVILYHKMNAEMEQQVVGRAVRFERAAPLRVVHLVHEGEVTVPAVAAADSE